MNIPKTKMAFSLAICVKSGDGYEKGMIYPIVGLNNGVHILRRDNGDTNRADPHDGLFMTGGIGEGMITPWDDSGAPSFEFYNGERRNRAIFKTVDSAQTE